MSQSLDEFRQTRAQPSAERVRRTAEALETISREAVRAQNMTGDANWDHFLTYLEAARRAAVKHRDFEFEKLRDPMMVNADEIAKCKAKINGVDARIDTLEEIMALPRTLIANGERAREMIAEMIKDAA